MSSDRALNRLEHTLLCSKFLREHFAIRRWQDNSDSQAQERKGHVLSTKTLWLVYHHAILTIIDPALMH